MKKFMKDQIVTCISDCKDYRINAIANFTDFYNGVAIDEKDHPYYHCIPIDDGEAKYIPEKLLKALSLKDDYNDLEWITNTIYGSDDHIMAKLSNSYVIGEPKSISEYNIEKLKDLGMIGIYRKVIL